MSSREEVSIIQLKSEFIQNFNLSYSSDNFDFKIFLNNFPIADKNENNWLEMILLLRKKNYCLRINNQNQQQNYK